MNVLFGDILLIFIPDREIRGVVLRTPPPPKKKIFWGGSLQGFGPQFGLKIRRGSRAPPLNPPLSCLNKLLDMYRLALSPITPNGKILRECRVN